MSRPVVVGIDLDAEVVKIMPEMHQEMLKTLVQIIQHFNLNWKVLQALMITTGAVITGSAVLAVLHTGDFIPQDLDIYIMSRNFVTILVFLNEQGYVMQIPPQDAMINNYTYTKSSIKLSLKDHKGNKIDLIATTVVFGSLVWSGFLTPRAIDRNHNQSFYFGILTKTRPN